jgi:hypothetical protein
MKYSQMISNTDAKFRSHEFVSETKEFYCVWTWPINEDPAANENNPF